MNAAKHTPGPWTCQAGYGNNGLRIDSEASGSLGHVRTFIPSGEIRHGSEVLMRWEEGFANARLVAAAPELLEALEELVDEFTSIYRQAWSDDADPEAHPFVVFARQTIAKATGLAA